MRSTMSRQRATGVPRRRRTPSSSQGGSGQALIVWLDSQAGPTQSGRDERGLAGGVGRRIARAGGGSELPALILRGKRGISTQRVAKGKPLPPKIAASFGEVKSMRRLPPVAARLAKPKRFGSMLAVDIPERLQRLPRA